MLSQGHGSRKHSILCCRPHSWLDRLWGPFEDILGYCFPAYVGSITASNPSGLLNNISKAIKASFQEDASGSAESGWESQPNYFQLVVNCRKVDFTSLELQLPLIKSRLCWRRWGKMKQLNLSSIKLLCIPQHRVLLLSRGVIKMNWLNYNLIDWRAPVHCTKAELPLIAVLSLRHKVRLHLCQSPVTDALNPSGAASAWRPARDSDRQWCPEKMHKYQPWHLHLLTWQKELCRCDSFWALWSGEIIQMDPRSWEPFQLVSRVLWLERNQKCDLIALEIKDMPVS